MIRRLIILLLIVGCSTEPKDCAGVAGGDGSLDVVDVVMLVDIIMNP